MAKTVVVLKEATFINGPLKGISGKVVAYDYLKDEVIIELDETTSITATSEMIEQDI